MSEITDERKKEINEKFTTDKWWGGDENELWLHFYDGPELNAADLKYIDSLLKQEDKKITRLTLNGCGINDITIKSISEALKTNKTLKRLDLYRNEITDVKSIGEALKTNDTLQELGLGNNKITDVKSIGEALEINKKLQTLYLYRNEIKDVKSIGKALKTNNTLQRLNLVNNKITYDSGIQSIIDVLKTNNTLDELYLSHNPELVSKKEDLKDIEKYKQYGSKGYKQVRGMVLVWENNDWRSVDPEDGDMESYLLNKINLRF